MRDLKSCTFTDDLKIDDRGLLATLSLLYDTIYLPHPYAHDPNCETILSLSFDREAYLEIERRWYREWKQENAELFQCGILRVLPSPFVIADNPREFDQRLMKFKGSVSRGFTQSDVLDGTIALAMHAVYANSPAPDFATINATSPPTSKISAELASIMMGQHLPTLPSITPEQILELREETASLRDAFRLYLASLADNVESRMQRGPKSLGASIEETYVRQVEPELEEYFRRRLPDRIQWWAHVATFIAEGAGGIIKIVATPWKFGTYQKLASSAARLTEEYAERVARQTSNKELAFQFIGKVKKLRV